MRIAHVTATFPPYYAGTGTVVYHNAVGLARLGHEVTVFTACHPPGDHAYPHEITVRRLPVLFRVGNAPLIPGLLQMNGFEIIHLHHPFIFGAEMVWAVSQARGIPYVLTHHNDLIGQGLRRYLFAAYSVPSARLVLRGASRFVAVSKDHAAHCRLSPLFRSRWDDVVEVPNGVDTDLFRIDLDGMPVRRRHGIREDARVLLFVGALDRAHDFKGVDLLIKVFAELSDDRCMLLIVGDGDLKVRYEQLARELEVAARVRFVGAKSHEELPSYYAAADLVVLPSFPPESFGVVLIEAMACGKPIVASNIPGVRSVVCDGENGLLVRPGDSDDLTNKLQQLLADASRGREMGARGRARVEERYAWSVIIPRLGKIYEEVVGQEPVP